MFNKYFIGGIISVVLVVPFFVYISGFYYFKHYDNLGEQFDCFPFSECNFDVDGDSIPEIVKVVNESNATEKYNFRLKIFANNETSRKEILNIKYESIDSSYRTHIAFLKENNVKKVIIYDTLNEHQFYYWDNEKLIPNSNPSKFEKEIRKALGYNDDTGGFHWKIYYPDVILFFSFFYYCFVFGSIMIYLKYRKAKSNKLNLK